MLDKFKRNKKDKDLDIFIHNDELDIFDEEEISKTKKKEPRKGSLFKKFAVLAVLALAVGMGVTYGIPVMKQKKELEADNSLKTEMFKEIHTKLEWYMIYGSKEEQLESTSKLVGHTMQTGCTLSYGSLQKKYDKVSLEYLYDFLAGRPCREYITSATVNLDLGENASSFLVRAGSNNQRYTLTVYHSEDILTSFKVELYVPKDKIE